MRTLQRWKRSGVKDSRKGAVKHVARKISAAGRQEIVEQCNSDRFQDLNPHEIVPLLLDEGHYLGSVSTFYRVLNENDLIHHRSNTKPKSGCCKPLEQAATGPDQVYCWDITWLPRVVKGLFFYAYVIIDIFDRMIVGWAVHEEESEHHSRDLFERTLQGKKNTLRALHSDNGHPMKGISLMALMRELNVEISHSRPRVSNDNPFIESLFKTLKYRVNYPLRFRDLEHAREWLAGFVHWYNTEHLHSAIGHVTPAQLRSGEADEIFEHRNAVMQQAKLNYPERWGARTMKVWAAPHEVVLNPEKSADY